MTKEKNIKTQAKRFVKGFVSCSSRAYSHIEFRKALESALSGYSTSNEKMIFLNQIHKYMDVKFKKHLRRWSHKEFTLDCPGCSFYSRSLYFVEQEIQQLNPTFHFTFHRPDAGSTANENNIHLMKQLLEVAMLYENASAKLSLWQFEKDFIDDLLLSFDLGLKAMLKEEQSLEKQMPKSRNSLELNTIITTMIEYNAHFHNSYIKHNEHNNPYDMILFLMLALSFINFFRNTIQNIPVH